MWKRKDDKEVEKIRTQLKKSSMDMSYPIIVIILGSILLIFSRAFGLSVHYSNPIGFSLYNIISSILASLVTACLIFIFQKISGIGLDHFNDFKKICTKCNNKNQKLFNKCKCGGLLEPIEFYTEIKIDD